MFAKTAQMLYRPHAQLRRFAYPTSAAWLSLYPTASVRTAATAQPEGENNNNNNNNNEQKRRGKWGPRSRAELYGLILGASVFPLSVSYMKYREDQRLLQNPPQLAPDFAASKDNKMAVQMTSKPQLGGPFELLESATGKPTTDVQLFADHWTLLYFGFSKCAEICPNTMRFLSELMDTCDATYGNTQVDGSATAAPGAKPFKAATKEDEAAIRAATAAHPDTAAQQAKLQTVFVSVDYIRDAPPVLEAFLQKFKETQPDPERIRGLCGNKDAVEQAARVWRVYFSSVDETDEERMVREAKGVDAAKPIDDTYQFDHSSAIYLVGPDGKMKDFFFREMGIKDVVDRVGVHYDDVYGFSDTRAKK